MPLPPITRLSNLEIANTNHSILGAPVMTQEERDTLPPKFVRDGILIYVTGVGLQLRSGNIWRTLSTGGGGGGGDVTGPDVSAVGDIAVFSSLDGKQIGDSGVSINQVPPLFASAQKSLKAVTVNEVGQLGHIRFINDLGIIFVDSLMAVEYITNNYGVDEQVCSLFTGGLPSSSSSPSALVELQSTTGALLVSRMSTAAISGLTSPQNGMVVYDTTTDEFAFRENSIWRKFYGAGKPTFFIDTYGTTENFYAGTEAGQGSIGNPASYNTGVGLNSQAHISSGSRNTSLGYNSLANFTHGDGNVALGSDTLVNAANCSENIAIGDQVLYNNITGSYNIGIGASALQTTSDTSYSIAIGEQTLMNVSGWYNIAIGSQSGMQAASATNNVSIGANSLFQNTDGASNVAIGVRTLMYNVASENIAIGFEALMNSQDASRNIGIGFQAFYNSMNSNSSDNIGVGNYTCYNNVEGARNIAIGTESQYGIKNGISNISIGHLSLHENNSGSNNLAIGETALFKNQGNTNIAIGSLVLYSNSSGTNNVGIGYGSLYTNDIGNENTAIGVNALYANIDGTGNAIFGTYAAISNERGAFNSVIGYQSFYSNRRGNYCTTLGYRAGYNMDSYDNSTALGANSDVTASNVVVLGNSCFVGIGTTAPQYALHLGRIYAPNVEPRLYIETSDIPSPPPDTQAGIFSVFKGMPKFTSGSANYRGTVVTANNSAPGQTCGTNVLNGTTGVTINTSAITTGSLVFITRNVGSNGAPSAANLGHITVSNIVNGTSFRVVSTNTVDLYAFNWHIINP